jgi:glycosyltransferase involved in cell wall biosynthesis
MFASLSERGKVKIKVFYTWGKSVLKDKYDPGFGKNISWDIPLLEGYDHSFIQNVATDPGSHHFKGIYNPTLINDIEKWKADAILVYGWAFKSHLKAMRHFYGRIPVFFRGDSTLLNERKGILIKIAKRVLVRWVYRHVTKAFYVGQANKAYFKRNGLIENQLVFAPHAIDNKRFNEAGKDNFRQQLLIPNDAIVFLFAGKFENKKNPLMLLEAFIKLNAPDSYLLLVGNGKLEEDLKQRCRQAYDNIGSRIHFMGFQNQSVMPAIYQTGNVLVLPSQGPGETWGLSVNEAMASSLAVLVSDKCGCSLDLVQEGKNGYIFKANDINGLIDCMQKMLNDNNTKELGKASKKIIADWSFENIALAIENELIVSNEPNENQS